MTDLVTTVAEIIGAVLIVVGVSLLSFPFALIVAGVLTILISYLVANQ